MSAYWGLLILLLAIVAMYLCMFYKLNKERKEIREIKKAYIELTNKIIHESRQEGIK